MHFQCRSRLLLLVILFVSCSSPVSVENEGLTLINRTTNSITYLAIELETTHHINLIWKSRITQNQENILQPDDSVIISPKEITVLEQYKPVEDIVLNLWKVIGDSAFYSSGVTFTQEELKQREFHIEIEEGANNSLVVRSKN